jgi:microcystin-dependent protein
MSLIDPVFRACYTAEGSPARERENVLSTPNVGSSFLLIVPSWIDLYAASTEVTMGIEIKTGETFKEIADRTPTGSVIAYCGETAPTGWLICDGMAVSRTTYAELFAVMGVAFGSGDGVNTFDLPDFRGQFLRGWSNGSTIDPDRGSRTAMATGGNSGDNIGSVQATATKRPNTNFTTQTGSTGTGSSGNDSPDHTHQVHRGSGISAASNIVVYAANHYDYQASGGASARHTHSVPALSIPSLAVNGGGDNETRPTNAYVNYIIKY